MPSLGQNGGAMNDSFAQQAAQTPSPSTGSRHATQSVGSAMSSASRAAWRHAPRHAFSAPRKWPVMERDGDASASMGARLAPRVSPLKRQTNQELWFVLYSYYNAARLDDDPIIFEAQLQS
jgi:hypothetical protein